MKNLGQRTRNEKGVTIVALAVTIIVLLILASISIAMLSGNHGLVEVASDSQIETELSQLQQTLNRYKLGGEDKRIESGDYSGQMTNEDLIKAGIIYKVQVKNPEMTIGIIHLDKIGVTSNLGNNASNVTQGEIENFSDLYDVFVIDLNTNDIYYVKNGDYWIREGEGNRDKSKETEGGPKISVTPNKYVGEGGTPVIISVAKGESELASYNEYEYYLSSSSYDLQRGKWTSYTSGATQNIGDGLTGKYYIYVKQVEDEKGKLSTGGDIVIIRGEKYHRFGKFVFEKGESEEYTITYNLNGGTVSGNPTAYTEETETFTLNNPTRLGYEFLGWTGSNGKIPEKTVTIEKGSTGNRVYEANWNINKYTVTYNYAENGGTSATRTSAIVNYGSLIDLTPTAVKDGYTFVGWNTDKNATTGMSSIKMGTLDVTLYAIYRKDITLTFVDYKGTDKIERTIEDTVYNKETSITVTAPTINSYTGWTARYWATGTGADAGQTVASGATISNVTGNATYYARYYQSIIVKFDLNGGTGVAPQAVTGARETNSYAINTVTNPTLTMPTTTATKEGYTFGGWNQNTAGTGTNYTAGTKYTFAASTTLYAKWTANTYTVKYNGNGATGGSTANSTHTYDVEKALTANGYTRQYTVTYNYNGNGAENTTDVAKYTFKNWNTAANGSGTSYTDKQVVKNLSSTDGGTVTLYAQWNEAAVTLPTPTRTGYAFAGWYDATTGGNKVGDGGAAYIPTENKTLYARWTENGYTIKYDGNGATGGSTASSSHKYDEEKELTANGYTREYTVTYNYNGSGTTNTTAKATYTFKNWNDKADGSGTTYTDRQKVENLTDKVGEIITLYAQWNEAEVTLPTPTREGYAFAGWYDAEIGGTKVADGGAKYVPKANTTLYAQWNVNSYTVTYDYAKNGGTSATKTTATVNYGSAIDLTPTATKSGYVFVGWNTDENATTKLSSLTMSTSNVTLYAIYSKTVTATFNYYNKQSKTVSGTMYNKATTTDIKAPDITDTASVNSVTYTMRGWATTEAGNASIALANDGTIPLSSSATYYASYSATITATLYVYNNSSSTETGTAYLNYAGEVTKASIALGTTSLSGYTFRGWSTSDAADATITVAANGTASIDKNTTYYASYSTTITATLYVYNSSSTKTGTVCMNYKGTKTKASIALGTTSLSGYTFRGWSTSDAADATITVAANGTASIDKNTTYYASYSYTVTLSYNVNGGSGTFNSQNGTAYMNYAGSKIGAKLTVNSTKPTRTGYTFLTWNTDLSETGTSYSPGESIELSTKVTLYAIWKDTTPPVIGTLTFSPTESTQGDVTLTGKATDLGSGISYYQFSTNGSLTSSSSGWTSITNTTKEITQTYSVSSNGTYYFYTKDAVGNVNKKAIVISNIRYVAQIGDIKYRTLREAIEAVKTDETILMIGDTTENNTVSEDKKFTLDLGEQTITGMFINNGNITITGNGTIYMETLLKAGSNLVTDEYSEVLINNYGILTINSGNYKVMKEGGTIIQNHETMTMNSGNIERNGDGWGIENKSAFYFNGGSITLNYEGSGTALYNTSGTIEMTAGTINSKSYGLVVDGGKVTTYGGSINIIGTGGAHAVSVRNKGKGTFINTNIKGGTLNDAVRNLTDSFTNFIIRNRNNNYGITGGISGKVLATTNTDVGQSSEKVTIYNTDHSHLLFPTWTEKNGQDDIDWMRSQSSSQTHTITVEKLKHNNETGIYYVHIYAASGDGNWNAEKGLGNITLEF